MTFHRSPTQDTQLWQLLADEVARTSLTIVSEKTGVARTSIEAIVKNRIKGYPDVETLLAFARAFRLPRWRLFEMTGIDMHLPKTPADRAIRLAQLAEQRPSLQQIIDWLLVATEKDTEALLIATRVVTSTSGR